MSSSTGPLPVRDRRGVLRLRSPGPCAPPTPFVTSRTELVLLSLRPEHAHRSRLLAALVATLAALSLSGLWAPSASAAPGDAPTDAAGIATASAEVDRVTALVAVAEEELARVTVLAEAAADADRAAQESLVAAQAAQVETAAQLQTAIAATEVAEADVATLGREAFMGQQSLGAATVLLDAAGPEDVLQRAATLERLGVDRSERLEAVELVQDQQADADAAAQTAVTQLDAAAATAAQADVAAQDELAAAQASYATAEAERAALAQQLLDAQVALLTAQGVEDAEAAAAAAATAATEVATAGTGQLVTGRITSCYGSRWGTTHYGIDIAAPIGTPIYAPEGGVVLQAGPASGFGQAVYLQHANGVITLYGHVDSFDVRAGQVVETGQKIAEVGNRGQSTGPHLHIETHYAGLYQDRQNPAPWLQAHGIDVGSCG